jgi:hypothetical protein
MMNRSMRLMALLSAAALLTACAALNTVTSDVTTFSEWPAGRKVSSYAFERLPSQKANAQRQAALEGAAAAALEKAGFKPAADAAQADVVVQVGARVSRTEISPWDDPCGGAGARPATGARPVGAMARARRFTPG